MTISDIANIRLVNQQITASQFSSAKTLVSFMGAMQAQDYAMAKWAVGLRMKKATDKKIEKAIHDGQIIRTHVMRPTWHFVSSDDLRWMIELTVPQVKAIAKSRDKQLGLTEKIFTSCNKIFEKSLRDENHLTRDELKELFVDRKFSITPEQLTHALIHAEMDGIVCSGKIKNNRQTYALIEERIPKKKALKKEEALALLAKKYFTSHAPASLKDFIWWSGLSVKDATSALESIKKNFVSEKIGAETYWLTDSFDKKMIEKNSVYLLPAFDEFLISYRDRTASLHADHHKKSISNNGIFWPMIVVNGQVLGSWKRSITDEKVIIEPTLFKTQNKKIIAEIKKSAKTFGDFLERKIEISF